MYLNIDEGFFSHPKTLRLQRLLGSDTGEAFLVRLWIYCCRYFKSGVFSQGDDGMIELAVDWRGDPGRLVSALVESGFLDRNAEGTLSLHDWMHWTGWDMVRQERRETKALARKERYTNNWPAIRLGIIARDKICQGCKSDGPLDIHHRVPALDCSSAEEANDPSNLVALCPRCHSRADAEYRATGQILYGPSAEAQIQ